MMEIMKKTEGSTVTVSLIGRLDTVTSPQLAESLEGLFEEGAINLVFDFSALDYISSAGLRVLLATQKKVKALGTVMEIRGANESIMEVFEITGFSDIFKII